MKKLSLLIALVFLVSTMMGIIGCAQEEVAPPEKPTVPQKPTVPAAKPPAPEKPAPKKIVSWYPTGSGTRGHGISVAVASIVNKHSETVEIQVTPGQGTTVQTRQLLKGEIDIGLSTFQLAVDAATGKDPWGKEFARETT